VAIAAIVERIGQATEAAAATARELLGRSPRGVALLELLRAERARLEGRDDAAGWQAVAAAFEAAARPYPAAYAHFRAGARILAARGDRGAARGELAVAAAGARRLRARPLLGEIEVLARHARLEIGDDDRPSAPAPDTADALGLTDREREVLRLVAGGWTNQQIADALFITRKTASVHVSNVMAKLGVEGRTAAAAAAYRLGLAGDAPEPPDVAAPTVTGYGK
jgi:DNA-binding NarL/FixJ family response regulator